MASAIYNPSYISFECALSLHGMIPETVREYTSATIGKNRTKRYENAFGRYSYRDVPDEVFSMEVTMHKTDSHITWIATREKALCDELYKIKPIDFSIEPMEALLFDDLRIDEEIFFELDKDVIKDLSGKYHCKNVKMLSKYLETLN